MSARRLAVGLSLLTACAATEPVETKDPKDMSLASRGAAPAAPATATARPGDAAPIAANPPVNAPPAANDPAWHATLTAIAADYASWGRVDDEMRFAPFLCRMPQPGFMHLSTSEDPATHGEKIYSLYALDPEAYGAPKTVAFGEIKPPSPEIAGLEQVIVKEAFVPAALTGAALETATLGSIQGEPLPATREGVAYGRGPRAGLYVMLRPRDPEGPTDAGWIYGTIAADGTITGAGRIEQCMGCHQSEPGRLFGITDGAIKHPYGGARPGSNGQHNAPARP